VFALNFNYYRYALLFISLGMLWSACETDIKQINKITSKKEAAVEIGKEVEVLYSAEGKVVYKILGSKLIRHNTADPYTEFPEGVELFVFNDSMEVESKLIADYGVNYELQNKMIVKGHVRLMNNKGEQLRTEELTWSKKKQKVYSDKFVKITTPKEIIYGDGFEANEDFTNYEIKKIRGTIAVETENSVIQSRESGDDSPSSKP